MLEYFKKIIIIAVILFFHLSGASIKGIIRDKDSHAPLIGANVFLNETSQGSATDFDGFYVIENIKFCSNCKCGNMLQNSSIISCAKGSSSIIIYLSMFFYF